MITLITFLLGTSIRFFFVNLSPVLPLNDGGMFYVMTKELVDNNFRIPLTTSYNNLNIPFVYPPAGFWLLALLHKVSNVSLLTLQKFIPPLISSLTLIPFYFLSKKLLGRNPTRYAFIFFAFSHFNFEWQIMGGGITRAPGMFFALLYLLSFPKFMLSTIFLSLTFIFHPQWTEYAIISSLILFINKNNLRQYLAILLASLLLISPWWINIYSQHTLNALHKAFLSTNFLITPLPNPILFMPFILGLFISLHKRPRFFIWSLIFFLLGTRNLYNLISIQIIIISSYAIAFFQKTFLSKTIVPILILSMTIGIIYFQINILNTYNPNSSSNVTSNDISAFSWITNHTPPNSKFDIRLQSPNANNPGYSQLSEWFPALTKRSSLSTPQGQEWIDVSTTRRLVEQTPTNKNINLGDKSELADFIYTRPENVVFPETQIIYQNPTVIIYRLR